MNKKNKKKMKDTHNQHEQQNTNGKRKGKLKKIRAEAKRVLVNSLCAAKCA